jgi:hypothetical protein
MAAVLFPTVTAAVFQKAEVSQKVVALVIILASQMEMEFLMEMELVKLLVLASV